MAARLDGGAAIPDHSVDRCTITYENLRIAAGIGGIARGVGVHLQKVSGWCSLRDYPPLDSFVVRSQERNPGEGYEETTASEGDWREDVRKCLRFRGYPKAVQ